MIVLSVTVNATFVSQHVTHESRVNATRRMYIDGQISKRSLGALIICFHNGTLSFVGIHLRQ